MKTAAAECRRRGQVSERLKAISDLDKPLCRLGRLDFPHFLSLRSSSFKKKYGGNVVIAGTAIIAMSNKCICEMLMLEHTSRVKLCWSLAKIKAFTYASFKMTCGVD